LPERRGIRTRQTSGRTISFGLKMMGGALMEEECEKAMKVVLDV
jgi:hypothetical protein